jgi:hypothetical protein
MFAERENIYYQRIELMFGTTPGKFIRLKPGVFSNNAKRKSDKP